MSGSPGADTEAPAAACRRCPWSRPRREVGSGVGLGPAHVGAAARGVASLQLLPCTSCARHLLTHAATAWSPAPPVGAHRGGGQEWETGPTLRTQGFGAGKGWEPRISREQGHRRGSGVGARVMGQRPAGTGRGAPMQHSALEGLSMEPAMAPAACPWTWHPVRPWRGARSCPGITWMQAMRHGPAAGGAVPPPPQNRRGPGRPWLQHEPGHFMGTAARALPRRVPGAGREQACLLVSRGRAH